MVTKRVRGRVPGLLKGYMQRCCGYLKGAGKSAIVTKRGLKMVQGRVQWLPKGYREGRHGY